MDEALEFQAVRGGISAAFLISTSCTHRSPSGRVRGALAEFLDADPSLRDVLQRTDSLIRYPQTMQKDAYNALADNRYDLSLAVTGGLRSQFDGRPVYGTPPTRWLHSKKMKSGLAQIKAEVLRTAEVTPRHPRRVTEPAVPTISRRG